jgi:hypothetical protein
MNTASATRQLEILALRSLELADRVAAGEIKFIDAFKEKFGMPPPTWSGEPIEPTAEVLAWVRSRNIAWAKAQEKQRAG